MRHQLLEAKEGSRGSEIAQALELDVHVLKGWLCHLLAEDLISDIIIT